jgi:conjugal transfer/type IV secretion protein DotA/TraY
VLVKRDKTRIPSQQQASLLATLFTVFNSGILVVGSIIVSYVAVMGAVNTANDGEAMGKAWSTVWTPVDRRWWSCATAIHQRL